MADVPFPPGRAAAGQPQALRAGGTPTAQAATRICLNRFQVFLCEPGARVTESRCNHSLSQAALSIAAARLEKLASKKGAAAFSLHWQGPGAAGQCRARAFASLMHRADSS